MLHQHENQPTEEVAPRGQPQGEELGIEVKQAPQSETAMPQTSESVTPASESTSVRTPPLASEAAGEEMPLQPAWDLWDLQDPFWQQALDEFASVEEQHLAEMQSMETAQEAEMAESHLSWDRESGHGVGTATVTSTLASASTSISTSTQETSLQGNEAQGTVEQEAAAQVEQEVVAVEVTEAKGRANYEANPAAKSESQEPYRAESQVEQRTEFQTAPQDEHQSQYQAAPQAESQAESPTPTKSRDFNMLLPWHKLVAWGRKLGDAAVLRAGKQVLIDYLASSGEDFSIHWRENYELSLGRWWLGFALAYLLCALLLPWLPWQNTALATSLSHMCWLLAILTLGVGLWRMAQGWKNQQWLEQRYQRQLLITTSTDLQQNHISGNKWWLGKGFYWNSKHSFRQQNLQQHLESGQLLYRSHPPAAGKAMGANWLHILEAQEQNIYLDCDHTNGHMLIVGTTGAGKTRAFDLLIQQAILRREAVVIIDPKGDHDLREKALQAAYRLNMADKFLVFNPAYAQQSIALDLLGNYSKTSDLAQRIISLIPPSANAGPFRAVSYKAVLTIIDALTLLDQKITISRIYISLTVGLKPLVVEVLRYMFKRYNLVDLDPNDALDPDITTRELNNMVRYYVVNYHKYLKVEAVINLFELYQHDHAHLTKMIATLLPGLQVLASPPMNDLISPELEPTHQRILFNLQSLTTDNYILYVGLDSLSDATLSGNIGSLLLSDLAALAGMIYNYKDVKKPINIFVDEAAEVVNDAFIQILNKGRGAGLRCFTATQTIADFNVRTGSYDKTRQMLGNFNNWLALRTNDYDTQNYLAQSLRKTRVSVKHASYAHHDLLSSNNQSDSMHHEQTNLITPDIFAELRNFEYIARVSGGSLIKGRLPIVNLD